MAFTIFFFAAWLTLALFAVMRKRLSLIENTFVFMVIFVININWAWIIFEETNFVKLTTEGMDYTAFLLFRSIIIPMILVIQLNLIPKFNTALVIITSVIILLFLTYLSTFFHVTDYTKWNLGYDALYYIFLHVISYYSLQLFRKTANNEVNYS
ncbi:hypothetical protein [Alteribacillus bidgolensis]|uniref:Uncharacterized protein n=1 Tax=Alteribacillus bidgolensis TaxID=930129 RepID=A0A1G8NMB3_9BACI|nr:hypothetical protein [Alteribacillus bidgolensis]SDI81399.1 hypothetical protein SAMN05216352_11283 [Alteribacillus bidgolensis]